MKRMIQGESLIRKATKCSFILSIVDSYKKYNFK